MSQHPFDLGPLVWPSLTIFVIVFGVSLALLRRPGTAIGIATIKTTIFLAYFGWFFDGTFTYLDDWTYFERGAYIYDLGLNPSDLLDSLPLLLAIGEGDHFLYYVYNALTFNLFGTYYFAPVAMNVLLTSLIAWLGVRLAVSERLCSLRQASLFFIFLILHPDITTWSSLVNGKDTLVLLLHVLLLTSVSGFLRGRRLAPLLLAGTAVTALLFLRFYVPVMFAIALSACAFSTVRGAARWRAALVASMTLIGLLLVIGDSLSFAMESVRAQFVNPFVGFTRFLLTPIPFNTDAAFAFLDLPALLHWLMLPALILGAWKLQRVGTPFSRVLVFYVLVFAALYAVYGELQGPRHRLQLDYAFALFQFTGFGVLARLIAIKASQPDCNAAIPPKVPEAR